jgi:hypothetical protein
VRERRRRLVCNAPAIAPVCTVTHPEDLEADSMEQDDIEQAINDVLGDLAAPYWLAVVHRTPSVWDATLKTTHGTFDHRGVV